MILITPWVMRLAPIGVFALAAIALIPGVLGLPLEAMGLLLIMDRLLDMFRTTSTCIATPWVRSSWRI
ncbi:MAG: hypothetical protein ACYC3N_02110 [Halothiobacillus sp.]